MSRTGWQEQFGSGGTKRRRKEWLETTRRQISLGAGSSPLPLLSRGPALFCGRRTDAADPRTHLTPEKRNSTLLHEMESSGAGAFEGIFRQKRRIFGGSLGTATVRQLDSRLWKLWFFQRILVHNLANSTVFRKLLHYLVTFHLFRGEICVTVTQLAHHS